LAISRPSNKWRYFRQIWYTGRYWPYKAYCSQLCQQHFEIRLSIMQSLCRSWATSLWRSECGL